MRMRSVYLTLTVVSCLGLRTQAAPLTIGDPAPPIQVAKWIKGERVDKLEPDQTYVVEFWATWCGPCRTSIPHLTELQKKYKDRGVKFLGISVWESDQDEVAPFVKEMGDKMAYNVAIDDVSGGDKSKGKMAESWMTAADEGGIPTAFVVKKGKIAWIGHPMELDEPLAKIVAGDWNLAEAASNRRETKVLEQKLAKIFGKLNTFLQEQNEKSALKVLDEAIAEDAKLEERLGSLKFQLLLVSKQLKAASEYGDKLVTTLYRDEAPKLRAIAWGIVGPDSDLAASERDLKLALKAAERANELTKGENAVVLDTLAKVYFDSGDVGRALETQEKAVRLMNPEVKEIKDRLEQYQKAAAEKETKKK